ncbi:hypothetical protein [Rhodococcus sp. B10]|uniref:hypothetical protein n=1 Tax=Rhodococcus sp. B10 TaxID=2695876 RepID=UPI00142FF4B8|nr:hypothetical protein [Rhodococcus sp. B10]NIL77352.1 hypothetical protein [Rhodococcus sp. B10]
MERMHELADEIRETFEDRGWKIEKATQLDPAFHRSKRSQSALGRDLVIDAIEAAASRFGLGFRTGCGGGHDVIDVTDTSDRRFRVRKAAVSLETESYEIIGGSDSILRISDAEEDSLLKAERWVLGYTVDPSGLVEDIFAAKVLGMTGDAVPHLRLGPVVALGSGNLPAPNPSGRFRPADEDSLGDDFDGDSGTEDGAGEASAG